MWGAALLLLSSSKEQYTGIFSLDFISTLVFKIFSHLRSKQTATSLLPVFCCTLFGMQMYLEKPGIKITIRVLKIRVDVTKETRSGLQILYLCSNVLHLIDFSILMHKNLYKKSVLTRNSSHKKKIRANILFFKFSTSERAFFDQYKNLFNKSSTWKCTRLNFYIAVKQEMWRGGVEAVGFSGEHGHSLYSFQGF